MSWDIFVMNFPAEAGTPEDIPEDFIEKPIGKRDEIIARIKEIMPMADFSDKAWGKIEGPELGIEINLGNEEEVSSFAFHIHGSDVSASCIADILRHLKLRGVDSATGDFFDFDQPAEGMKKWRAYRDQILSPKGK